MLRAAQFDSRQRLVGTTPAHLSQCQRTGDHLGTTNTWNCAMEKSRARDLETPQASDGSAPGYTPGKPGPIVTVTAAELLAMKLPTRPMVLGPILPAGGLALLYAPRGVGKTFLALSIAWAVASGGRILRWQAPAPRNVLYVDGEMPARTLQERLRRIIGHADPSPEDADRLRFLASDLMELGLPSLASEHGQQLASRAAVGCDLAILDNLSSLTPGVRENESEDWEPIQRWLLTLRRAGKAVLVVHHAGKSGEQRGTSRREDVLDLVIALRHPQSYRPDEGARFIVHMEKARNIVGPDAERFEARLVEGADGGLQWIDSAPHDPHRRALELISLGQSVRDIAHATGVSKSTVQRLRTQLPGAVPMSQPPPSDSGTLGAMA